MNQILWSKMSIVWDNGCLYDESQKENRERGYSVGCDDSGTNALHC